MLVIAVNGLTHKQIMSVYGDVESHKQIVWTHVSDWTRKTENFGDLSHKSWMLACEGPRPKGGLWVYRLVGPGAQTDLRNV